MKKTFLSEWIISLIVSIIILAIVYFAGCFIMWEWIVIDSVMLQFARGFLIIMPLLIAIDKKKI